MRNLVPCTFEAGTRTIHIPLHEMTGVENIRLIVNETQKVVICSSMQKDNITSCVKDNVNGGWDVTYKNDIPALATGDMLTVEVDLGDMNYIDGTDWVMKARSMPVNGSAGTFAIGKNMGASLNPAKNNLIYLFQNTPVTDADLSGIVGATGSLEGLFKGCILLKKLDLSNITGNRFTSAVQGCTALEEIDLSSFLGVALYEGDNCFTACSSLRKMKIHPNALSSDGTAHTAIIKTATRLTDLTLSANASNNIYLSWQPNLNFSSVKNVLEHCANVNMSGKIITFYSSGLTIQDDIDGTLQTLYNSVVNTYGATIANLNITPYSE